MQAPQLGCELPADQHVAGAHVPVEQTFTVKELLIVDGETGVGIKPASSGPTEEEHGRCSGSRGRVPLSKVPNSQMLTLDPEINWQLIQG